MESVEAVLRGEGLQVSFHARGRQLVAVDDVSLEVGAGCSVAVVGESGSGKSTLLHALARGLVPDSGRVELCGVDISRLRGRALKRARAPLQVVMQDPSASLDPRMRIGSSLAEPMRAQGWSREDIRSRIAEVLAAVSLPSDAHRRYPPEFSGGQRQRIAIARALTVHPKVVLADEPVSALDVSIQAQIVDLLGTLRAETGVAYLVVTHDLALVPHVADEAIVMYLGRVVERGPARKVVTKPSHPYTAALVESIPTDRSRWARRAPLVGEPPSALERPQGCAYAARCPIADERCRIERPPVTLADGSHDHRVECWKPNQLVPFQGRRSA